MAMQTPAVASSPKVAAAPAAAVVGRRRHKLRHCVIRNRELDSSSRLCAAAAAEDGREGGEKKGMRRVAVLGASGYTGSEVMRLLSRSENFRIVAGTAERQAGSTLAECFPHLAVDAHAASMTLVPVGELDWHGVDCCFCCLPHGTTQEILKGVPDHVRTVDLSADFRLRNVEEYREWYGDEHRAQELQKEAVYGLSELNRGAIAGARLVANPGCYPTCSQLPLVPLIRNGLISPLGIIIDAKSGVSGAGRSVKQNFLFTEIADGMQAYGVTRHRHAPEIEQGLSDAAGVPVLVSFTPHLIPMSRGMQCTMYVSLSGSTTVSDLRNALESAYADEGFVHVLPEGTVPQTRHVRGSNHCLMNVFEDRLPGRAIVVSVIDNLVKGASGQAIQNMNILHGLDEACDLGGLAMFP